MTSRWTGWLTGTAGTSAGATLAAFDWQPTTLVMKAQATPIETKTRQIGDFHGKKIPPEACSGVLMPLQTPEGKSFGR